MDAIKYRDHKQKRKKQEGNSKYITTHKELEDFTKQVDAKAFGDKHFEKAYSEFKRPVYGMKEE